MHDVLPEQEQENIFKNCRLRREQQIRSACDHQASLLFGTLLTEPKPKLVFFFGKRHCHSVEVILALATQYHEQDNFSILVRHADVTTCAAIAQILCTQWHSESEGKMAITAPSNRRIDVHLYEKKSNCQKPRVVNVTFFTLQVPTADSHTQRSTQNLHS
jgi:hypothetical protein